MPPDQAVKSLCETWHPDDIPAVFVACGRESVLCAQPESSIPHADTPPPPPLMAAGLSKLFGTRNAQLPSPVSPTSRPSPPSSGDGSESYTQAPESSGGCNLIPIKGFVHEVLRRSRTSTGVLQTALCYLEAVRSKVPDLLRKEKARPTSEVCPEPDAEPRIVQGRFEQNDSPDMRADGTFPDVAECNVGSTLDTIRVDDAYSVCQTDTQMSPPTGPVASHGKEQNALPPLPPLPPLPSPLCCPRRTFLACLILASKFMQDRSYSNRAWAKLAGLPPREIGRCERAVGEALEWRLWVGKLPTTSASSEPSTGRAFARTRSDGDVLAAQHGPTCTLPSTAAWVGAAAGTDAQRWVSPSNVFASVPTPLPTPRTTRTIRRSATVPAIGTDCFTVSIDPFFVPAGRFDNAGYCYDVRSAPGTGFEHVTDMDVEPQLEVSPSLSTPTLSYSPMSSASSSSDGSEERTIQMSMLMDLPTPSLAGPSCAPWVASGLTHTPADPANPYRAANHINATNYYNNAPSVSMYAEAGAAENVENLVEGRAGPTLASIDAAGTKTVQATLPSFAEAFSGRCPGMLGFGTR
ncbi:hypothetical protein BD413DRAFT_602911 [Trametes elegans]|nr:hypothetical protein BD413DRAFT_602911 [Trametes elegans]